MSHDVGKMALKSMPIMSSRLSSAVVIACLILSGAAFAQGTIDLGLPPPSGSQNPVLPPPSGSQNPVLPPPSGQKYAPGVGGRFGDGGTRAVVPRPVSPRPLQGGDFGLIGSVSPATKAFSGDRLDRLDQIAPAIRRCWAVPAMDGPDDGVMLTVRFSLRRNGTIFGQPRIAWATNPANADLKTRFTASVLDAFRSCAPLRLSDGLGAAIAGRPFVIRFHGRAPSTERPI